MAMSGVLALISPSVCIGMAHKIALSSLSVYCLGPVLLPFSFCMDVKFFINIPVYVCDGLITIICIIIIIMVNFILFECF